MPQTSGSEVLELLVKLRDEASANLDKIDKSLTDIDKTTRKSDSALKRLRSRFASLSNAAFSLRGALASVGAGVLAKSFLDASSAAENFRVRLVRLLGSVEEGNRLFDEMSKYAATVAFEYRDILEGATLLSGIMEGGVDEITKWMPMIADLATVSGLGIQETTGQIIRMYSAGAASADLFRERGILSMLGFQAGVSYTAAETRRMLVEAYTDPASKFRDAASDLGQTWTGMLSILADAWFQFREMVGKAGAFDFVKAGLAEVLGLIQRLRDSGDLKLFAENMSKYVVASLELTIKAVALVGDSFNGWRLIWEGLRGAFALVAIAINTGLIALAETVDTIRTKLGNLVDDLGRVGSVIKLLPGPLGLIGAALETLEKYNVTVGETGKSLRENVSYWEDILQSSADTIENISGQESYLIRADKLLDTLRAKAQEYATATKDITRPQKAAPTISYEQSMKSSLARMTADIESALQGLDALYDKNFISLEEYYTRREELIERQARKEIEAFRARADAETNIDKKAVINDKIYALEEKLNRDLFALREDRVVKEREQQQRILDIEETFRDLRARVAKGDPHDLASRFTLEQEALAAAQAAEIRDLKDHNATKQQLNEAYRLHEQEQQILAVEQTRIANSKQIQMLVDVSGNMASLTRDIYTLTGEKNKELFIASKAFSVAQAIMKTYESATSAYASLSGIPYVGPALGAAAAAAAIASGLSRVAQIRQQKLATGGLVEGSSPSPTADDQQIWATAGEYMQPVSTVQHYGVQAMEAIRQKKVPRQLLSAFSVPNIRYGRTRFAEGGMVPTLTGIPSSSGPPEGTGAGQPINITNIAGDDMISRYLNSGAGKESIINVIGERAFEVKQILASEGA